MNWVRAAGTVTNREVRHIFGVMKETKYGPQALDVGVCERLLKRRGECRPSARTAQGARRNMAAHNIQPNRAREGLPREDRVPERA